MKIRRMLASTGVAAALIGGAVVSAPQASAATMSPTFSTLYGCQKLRAQYAKDGGFSYLSHCIHKYNRYYFMYD